MVSDVLMTVSPAIIRTLTATASTMSIKQVSRLTNIIGVRCRLAVTICQAIFVVYTLVSEYLQKSNSFAE